MRKNEGLMKIVVVAIVIFALMFVAMPVVAAECTQHQIPPTGQWTSSWFGTGISVTSGQTISITASGTVQPSTAKDIFAGPDGTFEVDNWQTSYSFRSDWGHEALIARIGASGDPIFIGTSTTFTAPTGGEVWLGVNDNDPGNNAGGFVVNVCLGQAPAPDPESNWTVDDITPLKGQIAGVVPDAGNVGEITGEPGLSDPTTDKEKIEAQIAEIEKLPDKEREKYRDELARLYDQLYLVNRHEELDWMLAEGLITVTDKSMGLIPKTALVWGISTGLTTLIMGDFEDGMNRLIGAIPWKNIGTAYSVILDAHSLLRPDGPGYRYQASQSPLVVLPPVP